MKKQFAIVVAAHVVLIAGAFTVSALSAEPQPVETVQQQSSPATAENDPKPAKSTKPAKKQSAEKPQEASETVETYQQPSESTNTQQDTQSAEPEPSQPPSAHVPFTNKPVTAGDPESYVDTVGQCPFYEMAGAKGCTPPPDIECNADWSECHLKGEGE